MNFFIVIPAIAGALTVFQAGLNRHIAREWSLSGAVLLNGAVLTLVALAAFLFTRIFPETFDFLGGKGDFRAFRWFWLLSGICGFLIVLGIPFAMARVGAMRTFVAIVSAQMIASVLWDLAVEGIRPTPARIGGALLAIGSALLVNAR